MRTSIVVVAVSFATVPLNASGMQSQLTSLSVTRELRSGTLSERQSAVASIGASPALLKDPDIINAIKDEFARYSGDERHWLKRVRVARSSKVPTPLPDSSPLRSFEYERDLEALMIDSKDPVFIPELTWAAGSSGKVVDALARFGEVAFPTVIERYRDVCHAALDCPGSLEYAMLLTMARMISNGSLTRPSQARAVAIATEAIRSEDWESISGAINVVAASCDDDLRHELSNILSGPRKLNGVAAPQLQGLLTRGEQALQACLEKRRP